MAASLPQISGLPVEVEQVVDAKVGDFQFSGAVAKVALHGLDDLTGQIVTDKALIPGEGNRLGLATAKGLKFLPGQWNIIIVHIVTPFGVMIAQQQTNVKGGGTMPQIEEMVKLLRELTEEDRLIVMGGMMALKAKHDAADEAA